MHLVTATAHASSLASGPRVPALPLPIRQPLLAILQGPQGQVSKRQIKWQLRHGGLQYCADEVISLVLM